MQQAVDYLVAKRQEDDSQGESGSQRAREEKQLETLLANIDKIQQWMDDNDDKIGRQGKPIKSNITDNDSAKITSSQASFKATTAWRQLMMPTKW